MNKALVFLVLLLPSLAYAQQKVELAAAPKPRCGTAADDDALRQVAQRWKEGYNRGDAESVGALYAEDAYYLTQHYAAGILHGRAAITAYVKHGVDAHYQVESIQLLSLDCSGDLAYTITRYESENAGQKAFGHNIVVLKKLNGKWLIVAHESAVPEATAIQKLQ